MWITVSRIAVRAGAQIFRQVSNFADDFGESFIQAKKIFLSDQDNKKNVKSLKIAILGLPNAGKSTLINHLIGRPVCATSSKIHTTRHKAAAIFCTDDTQLIFLDTPGLVSKKDIRKYRLENSFKTDGRNSMEEADVIGVIQDMSHVHARESISEKIIDLLKLSLNKPNSILILNKVDTINDKKILLQVIRKLTSQNNWPNFSDVFMISAKTGDGMNDLRNYLLDSAKLRDWQYNQNMYIDQSYDTTIQQIVKAVLLDNLPQEIPYQVKVIVEHIEYCGDGSINIVTNVDCPTRLVRIIIGRAGQRIKLIAKEAEQILSKIFITAIRLKIVVPIDGELVMKKPRI